jgi:hypothetical protein
MASRRCGTATGRGRPWPPTRPAASWGTLGSLVPGAEPVRFDGPSELGLLGAVAELAAMEEIQELLAADSDGVTVAQSLDARLRYGRKATVTASQLPDAEPFAANWPVAVESRSARPR